MDDRVPVPRWALATLVGVALLALLGLAFLLGRESARNAAVPAPTPVEVATADPAAGPTAEPEATLTPGRVPPRQEVASAPQSPPPAAPERAPALRAPSAPAAAAPPSASLAPTAPPGAAPPVDAAEKARVAEYFRSLDASVGMAAAWQNPDAVASSALQQGALGDSSGFDMILRANRDAMTRIRALSPPEPCREHHRRTLELGEAAVRLLERIRQGTLSGDSTALMAMATEGQQLQARVMDLESLGQQIRARYGL